MDLVHKCEADRCAKPACCQFNGGKRLCYFHVAMEKDGEITFFDMASAKRQATELKHVAAHVWEDLVDELEDVAKRVKPKQAASQKTPEARSVTPAAPVAITVNKRVNLWDDLHKSEASRSKGKEPNADEDILTSKSDIPCPNCHSEGTVRYRVLSSAIEASKADTWGSSSRPDRILRYNCLKCKHEWTVEEG